MRRVGGNFSRTLAPKPEELFFRSSSNLKAEPMAPGRLWPVLAVVEAVAALRAGRALANTTSPSIVCTSDFKSQMRTLFRSDLAGAAAGDAGELCAMCRRTGRLAMLLRNDARSSSEWTSALRRGACQYVGERRGEDCGVLVEGFLASAGPVLSTSSGLFTRKEATMSADQLAYSLDARSLAICKAMLCCPRGGHAPPPLWAPAPATGEQLQAGLEQVRIAHIKRFIIIIY